MRAAFEAAGFSVRSTKVTRVPSVTVPVAGEVAEANLALLEALEDEDDVSEVYANLEVEAEGA